MIIKGVPGPGTASNSEYDDIGAVQEHGRIQKIHI